MFSHGFAKLLPELLVLVESDVLLPLAVAGEAGEVADKLATGTFLALPPHGLVHGVRVLTPTQRPPLSDVKTFPTDQKVLSDLLRPSPHEEEVLTAAAFLLARILTKSSVLENLQFVFGVEMITEAPGQFAQPGALGLPLLVVESDVEPSQQGLPRVPELPLHELLGTHRGSVLLQPRQDGVRGLGLDGIEHRDCVVTGEQALATVSWPGSVTRVPLSYLLLVTSPPPSQLTV